MGEGGGDIKGVENEKQYVSCDPNFNAPCNKEFAAKILYIVPLRLISVPGTALQSIFVRNLGTSRLLTYNPLSDVEVFFVPVFNI